MQHDAAYKLLFSHPRMVRDLLRGFVSRRWCDKLDLSTLKKLSTEFVSKNLHVRRGDLLWSVRYRGSSRRLLVMLEFQSTVDPLMAERIQVYAGMLRLDPALREMFKQSESEGESVQVLPIVLYNGRRRWTAALDTVEMIATKPVMNVLKRRSAQCYILIDMGRYVDEDLPSRNLMSALIALENSKSPAALDAALKALIAWLQEPQGGTLASAFDTWVRQIVAYWFPGAEAQLAQVKGLSGVHTMLAERIAERMKEWTDGLKAESVAEGLAEGIAKGKAEGKAEGIAKGKARQGKAKGKAEGIAKGKARLKASPRARLKASPKSGRCCAVWRCASSMPTRPNGFRGCLTALRTRSVSPGSASGSSSARQGPSCSSAPGTRIAHRSRSVQRAGNASGHWPPAEH